MFSKSFTLSKNLESGVFVGRPKKKGRVKDSLYPVEQNNKNNETVNNELDKDKELCDVNLNNSTTFEFRYTFKQVKMFNSLKNEDKKICSINGIKKCSLLIFLFIVPIIYWCFGEFRFSNYNFTNLQSEFKYELLDKTICIYSLCLVFIIIIWVIAFFTHGVVYTILKNNTDLPSELKNNTDPPSDIRVLERICYLKDMFSIFKSDVFAPVRSKLDKFKKNF